jgi:hypothetical protein
LKITDHHRPLSVLEEVFVFLEGKDDGVASAPLSHREELELLLWFPKTESVAPRVSAPGGPFFPMYDDIKKNYDFLI